MSGPEASPRPDSSRSVMVWAFSVLSACLSAGYGVLFTLVGDYREVYGISELAIGWIIGVGFIVAFVAQVVIAPLGDRGHARTLVLAGVAVNAVGSAVACELADDVWLLQSVRVSHRRTADRLAQLR